MPLKHVFHWFLMIHTFLPKKKEWKTLSGFSTPTIDLEPFF